MTWNWSSTCDIRSGNSNPTGVDFGVANLTQGLASQVGPEDLPRPGLEQTVGRQAAASLVSSRSVLQNAVSKEWVAGATPSHGLSQPQQDHNSSAEAA